MRSHRTRWRGTIKMSWWRHQMGTFSALLAPWAGNSPVTGEFRHKGQWHGALVFSLVCAWTNGWINNRDAGDLRRQCAHYDVTVMPWLQMTFYLRMNKPMSKQSWGWWFETPSRSLWRHCNGDALQCMCTERGVQHCLEMINAGDHRTGGSIRLINFNNSMDK